jgi:hypothetical protein
LDDLNVVVGDEGIRPAPVVAGLFIVDSSVGAWITVKATNLLAANGEERNGIVASSI